MRSINKPFHERLHYLNLILFKLRSMNCDHNLDLSVI